MPIFGQNSILNVFVPKFLLKTPLDGQILVWDSDVKGFVNVSAPNILNGGMTAEQLRQFEMMKIYASINGVAFTTATPTFVQVSTPASYQINLQFMSTTVYEYATIVWGDDSAPTILTFKQISEGAIPTHTYSDTTPRTTTVTLYNPYGLGTPVNTQVTPVVIE